MRAGEGAGNSAIFGCFVKGTNQCHKSFFPFIKLEKNKEVYHEAKKIFSFFSRAFGLPKELSR